jgi:type I restriction enzyme S subunit
VDFDPIRAKVSGEPADSICHRLGLSPDLLPLFPSSFQDSELGETPPGWKYLPAEDVADIGIGKTPPRKEPQWFTNNPNDVPWVSIRDMGESGTFIHSTSEFLTDEAVQRFNIRIVPTHTVLLSFKLTIGRVAITDGEMVTNEAIAHFKLSSGSVLSSEFLYLYLKSFDYSRLGSTSSIAEAINSRTVKEIPILIPSDEVLRAFWNISSDLFTMIRQNQSQLKALVTTRDTLLPKLMSGELHVDGLLLHGDA